MIYTRTAADSAACHEIAAAFKAEPGKVENILCSRIKSSHGELQKLLVHPYDIVLRDKDWKPVSKRGEESLKTPSAAEKLAFERA